MSKTLSSTHVHQINPLLESFVSIPLPLSLWSFPPFDFPYVSTLSISDVCWLDVWVSLMTLLCVPPLNYFRVRKEGESEEDWCVVVERSLWSVLTPESTTVESLTWDVQDSTGLSLGSMTVFVTRDGRRQV